ncbi:MAG: hypothetical protein ACFCA4_13115 [Cyanophyceae cyanobacterium]
MQWVSLQDRVWGKVAAVVAGIVVGSAGGAIVQPAAAGSPCRMYTQGIPNSTSGYDIREVNNCPPINGVFQNRHWEVQFGQWEPGAFIYVGTDRRTGRSIDIINDEVQGTTDRPQYLFRNGDTLYKVTFRPSDSDTIRLEVFQNGRRILNQLLSRTS